MHHQVLSLQPYGSRGPLGTLFFENHAHGTIGLGSTTSVRQKRKFSSLRARILMMEISYFFTMHQQVFWLQPIWVQGTIGDPLTLKIMLLVPSDSGPPLWRAKRGNFPAFAHGFWWWKFLIFLPCTSKCFDFNHMGPRDHRGPSYFENHALGTIRTRVHHFGAPKEEIFQPSRTDFDDGNFLFFYHAPASVLTSTHMDPRDHRGPSYFENHALGTIRTRVHHFGAPKEEIFQPSRTDFDDGNFLFFCHAPASVLTSTIWVQRTIRDPLTLKIMLLVPFGLGSTTLARQKRKFSSLRARILMMEISYFFTMHQQVFWLQPYGSKGPLGSLLLWKSCSWYHSDSGPPLWRAKRGNFPAFAHGFWWWKFLIFLPCTSKCSDFNHMGPRDHWGPSYLKIMLLVPSDSGPPLWRAKRGNFPAFAHGF